MVRTVWDGREKERERERESGEHLLPRRRAEGLRGSGAPARRSPHLNTGSGRPNGSAALPSPSLFRARLSLAMTMY